MSSALFIEPLNVSLRAWGSILQSPQLPAVVSHIRDAVAAQEDAGAVIPVHPLQSESMPFDSARLKASAEVPPDHFETLLLNIVFIVVCLGLLLMCLMSPGDEREHLRNGRAGLESCSPMLQKCASLQDVQCMDGSWARAYRDATEEEREALELLFRCHIISTYEFAESKVSQEHIDECILIGLHMLCQKSLSDWVAMRYQAKEVFESNAAACFRVRSERSSRQLRSNPSEDTLILHPSSTSSLSTSVDSQPKSTARSSMSLHTPRSDIANVSEPQHRTLFRPAAKFQPLDLPQATAPQAKVATRPVVHIPRMDLRSLSSASFSCGQSSMEEDDDDPYTTRDIFK